MTVVWGLFCLFNNINLTPEAFPYVNPCPRQVGKTYILGYIRSGKIRKNVKWNAEISRYKKYTADKLNLGGSLQLWKNHTPVYIFAWRLRLKRYLMSFEWYKCRNYFVRPLKSLIEEKMFMSILKTKFSKRLNRCAQISILIFT